MNIKRTCIAVALGLSFGIHQAALGQGNTATRATLPTPVSADGPQTEGIAMMLEEHAQKIYRPGGTISRAAVGDPAIADVTIIQNRDVLVTGTKRGSTTLNVWIGNATTPIEYKVIVTGATNPMPLALDLQVQTDIKVAQVNRSTLREFGFNFLKNSSSSTIAISPPSALSGVTRPSGGGGDTFQSASGLLPLQDAFQLVLGDPSRSVLGILSLLESRGLVRTLAEPSLTTKSGQTATFLAGGEFPIPVVQGTGGGGVGGNSITVEFREFGVRLQMTPTVLDRSRIVLKVAPEVSELDYTNGITTSGFTVPALRVRRTDTTVELGDGESFVISGLVSQNLVANADKIPFLGSIPVIGAFFKSTLYRRDDSELIMVVTPHVVSPLVAKAATPPLPGAEYDRYNPGLGQLMFLEDGRSLSAPARTASGFSR